MRKAFEKWTSQLRAHIPERRVLLVPADTFYSHRFDLPPDIPEEERNGAIELLLEGVSPFPMEHLYWGFLFEEKTNQAFVYAVPHARLAKLGIEKIEDYFHAFPGFLSAIGPAFTRRTVRFVAENTAVTAVYFEPGESIPARVSSRRVQDEFLSDQAVLETRDKLAKAVPAAEGWAVEEGVFVGAGVVVEGEQKLICFHRRLLPETIKTPGPTESLPDSHAFPLAPEAVWAADIRSPEWAATESRNRRFSRSIFKITTAAGIFLIFLLLLQGLNFGLGIYNRSRAEHIVELQPRVQRINDTWTLAARITQSTEQDLAPFRMLELINEVRPQSVYFTRTRATAFNELRIEGFSAAVAPVNAYADSVRQLPFIADVENVVETRDGQTRFDLIIRFSEVPRDAEATQAGLASNEPSPHS